MSKRICLISPAHVSFNPRLVKEATALSAAGYVVHVIAANNLRYLRLLDSAILNEASWSFELVGGGSKIADLYRRGRTRLAKSILSRFDSHHLYELANHSLGGLLKEAALRFHADLYIAHYVAALPAAYYAAQRHKALWGFDAEDYHLGEFEVRQIQSVDARAVRAIESRYLDSAQYFTAASEGIAAAYARDYKRTVPSVVLNVFPRVNAPTTSTANGIALHQPSIYWFSQTIGINRGLECAIEAIARAATKPHLYLRGNLQQGIKEKLMSIAERWKVADRIHWLPVTFGAEMERLASEYDVGLVAETGFTENRQIALTNKLFSFLLAGVAVVASDTDGHRAFAATCGAVTLYPIDSPSGLAKIFDSLLSCPRVLEEFRYKSWSVGQNQYNWDIEQKKLIDAVVARIGPSGKREG